MANSAPPLRASRCVPAGVLLAALSLLSGARLEAQEEVRPPFRARPPVVDGRLDEWGRPTWALDREEQVWSREQAPWGGVADLSAEVWLAYDALHLYVAGRVVDDGRFPGTLGEAWHRQDAVEVFLVPDPEDGAVPRFDEDDLQLFVMPFSPERPWGLQDWQAVRPAGDQLTGVRVGIHQEEGGYSFELAVPFHNLPRFQPGQRRLGFGLAVDDYDPGSARYQYMTLNGENPTQQGAVSTVRFAGPEPLAGPDAVGGGWTAWLGDYGVFLAVPVLLLVLLLFGRRAWNALVARHPAAQPLGLLIGVGLFAVGLALPTWSANDREEELAARVDAVVDVLRPGLEELEAGPLGSYQGGTRDEPLMSLLRGEAIQGEQRFRAVHLDDLVPGRAEQGVVRPVVLGEFPIRPYWVPLAQGELQRFGFRQALGPGRVNLVLARPLSTFEFEREASSVVRLSRWDRDRTGAEPDQERLEFVGPFERVPGLGEDAFEVSYRSLQIERPTSAIGLTARDGGTLYLVGMSWESESGQEVRPLRLGEPSLGGVETGLRGPLPADAGFVLAPGASQEFALPAGAARGFEKLWLVFHGEYGGRAQPDLAVGDRVCRLELGYGEGPPSSLDFQHQVSMFFARDRYNQSLPEDAEVAPAYRWSDAEGELRVHFEREVDLDRELRTIRLVNEGPYPIRCRALVLGQSLASMPTYLADSPYERREAGSWALKGSILEGLEAVDFGIYRNGQRTAHTFGSESVWPVNLSSGIQDDLRDGSVAERELRDGEALLLERYFEPLGNAGSGEVIGVFLQDGDFVPTQRMLNGISWLLCLCAAPILLLLFGESLAVFNSLRLRLVAVLGAASLIPLGLLSYLLVHVLESGHEADVERQLEARSSTAVQALDERSAQFAQSARTWLDDLLDAFPVEIAGADSEDALRAVLHPIMQNQMPPDWQEDGGFLSFEFVPTPGEPERPRPFDLFVGAPEFATLDASMRAEPGILLSWGVPLLGVRVAAPIAGIGDGYLTVGRRLDPEFLAGLLPGAGLVLSGADGYPLAVATPDDRAGRELEDLAWWPTSVTDRRQRWESVLAAGQSVFARHEGIESEFAARYQILRDPREIPRLLLGVYEPARAATLPLPLGAVPVRAFFFAAGGVLLVFALFLSIVVASRISRPIEELEEAATALRHGDLGVQVAEPKGQIGRLSRNFNEMSQDLRGRIHDLRLLNRGIQELTAQLDLDDVLATAVEFFNRHSPADRVRILLADRGQITAYGGSSGSATSVDANHPDIAALLDLVGPCSFGGSTVAAPALSELVSDVRSGICLPLLLAGRRHGVVVLLFQSRTPPAVAFDTLWTMTNQTAAAIENARLYRHAVADRLSGAYLPDYFQRQLADEIAAAQGQEQPLALCGVRLEDESALAEALGATQYGRLRERMVRRLGEVFGAEAVIGCAPDCGLLVAVSGLGPQEASQRLEQFGRELPEWSRKLPSPWRNRLRFDHAVACYPEDGVSAEFLLAGLDARFHAGRESGAVRPLPTRREDLDRAGVQVESEALQAVLRTLERVAPSDLTLLFEGETGTGKEVLTDLVHRWSRRASGPLVKVHCAALPPTLLQSELFGHEKGAFTGATERKLGRFEQAHGGTIFLDEIGEISLDVQVQLLRVLQEREIDRVGGRQPVPVDVRVIAATNRDIEAMVREGSFREDLYYRLQGMVLRVPPLRERRVEIPGLVEHFRREAVEAGHTQVRGFHPDAMDELYRREWPGNIRELRNTVFRAMVMARGALVERDDLLGIGAGADPEAAPRPDGSGEGESPVAAGGPKAPVRTEAPVAVPRPDRPETGERQRVLMDLVRERGTVSSQDCAAALGVSQRSALRILSDLQERGLLEREGRRRGARYRIRTAGLANS